MSRQQNGALPASVDLVKVAQDADEWLAPAIRLKLEAN
jgi:hypothetical protein